MTDFQRLSQFAAELRGTLFTPQSDGYEAARALFNRAVTTRPAVLVRCLETQDVVRSIRFARENGLAVSVRAGGHHACGYCLTEGGLTLDLSQMKRIDFDPGARAVWVEPGCGSLDIGRVTYVDHEFLDDEGVPCGLAAVGGDCPTVGTSGFSLGGGYGILTRRHGLGCDNILEAEVVDASGRVLRASETENRDLLWALRGAGGAGFGVVTRLRYRLHAVPRTVFGGMIEWPLEQAEDVVRAYRDLYTGGGRQTPAPLRRAVEDDRLSLFMCFTTSPYPDGEPVVVLYGLYIGPAADGAQALAPLRRLGTPRLDQMGPVSYHALLEALGHEVPYGLRSKWVGGYFRSDGMSDEAIRTIVRRFRGLASPYSMARFDLLGGGALARVRPDATAFVHRESLFYLSIIALWEGEGESGANLRWARAFHDEMRPFLGHEVYQNYANGELEDWPRAYYGTNYPRLQRIKARYDPEDFFHHPQSIRLPREVAG